ncbi:P-loop containing nucleoside triphosphate hydrolase [Phytophthora cactorum]|nr:P-loop containing nucleoside triphosphate hydrolase [Phytophthora cactorum]
MNSAAVLQQEVWAFVESLAAPLAAPGLSPEARLEQIQQQAGDLLTRRREAASINGTDELADLAAAIITSNGEDNKEGEQDEKREAAATTEAEEKMYEAVNERIARRMIDGVEQPNRGGAATASTSEDKSDTLSDCTTITETSSVYGIHNTWVDLATLYSLPFVMSDSNHRLKPVPPLNITQEQSHLNKIFQECQRAVHTMRAVATVDALRKVLDRGVTVLHFSGHGGRIVGQSRYLMFEDTQCSGLAHLVDSTTLRSILNGGTSSSVVEEPIVSESSVSLEMTEDSAPPASDIGLPLRSASSRSIDGRPAINGTLKLVFVSSCDSKDIGEVFIQAGVAHVVCVRSEGRVLDESSAMFSYSFYHAALTGKTIQQAFEIARVRVSAEMRIPDGEGDKFVLLESSQLHAETCPLWSREEVPQAIEVDFEEKSCRCNASTLQFVFSDISVGKWVDVSPSNKFSKTLPPVAESFVGREQELHMLAELVNTRRLVTLRGPPGIGKSTLSIKLAHFLADRNAFPDGVAFIRLRGVQSLEGMESTIKSALFPEGGREKDMPLDQSLADMKVLLVMDNMEDPINSNPSATRDFLLQLLHNTPSLSFLMTARQAMGGGINEFDEKVVSLNRLSHYHAADLLIKKSPRALLVSEIGDIDTSGAKSISTSILEALVAHPLMAFLDGHPQAISLCAPLLQDRSLSELTRAVLSRGVSELQVVGLAAHDRSALNTLVASLDVSLEQVRMHHGQDTIRFFALLGLLPAGAMPADFKSLWGSKWEGWWRRFFDSRLFNEIVFQVSHWLSEAYPNEPWVRPVLVAALKSYSDFISNTSETAGKAESAEYDIPNGRGGSRRVLNDRHMLNSLTRSGRASRVSEHVERMDDHAEIMAVCVSYSTFPFIASYARSLLGMYDGDGAKNEVLESLCVADRDLFLYNTSRHFRKVSYWVFQHICTLTIESSAAYLILDLHESNLWMILDIHIRMIEECQAESNPSSPRLTITPADVHSTVDSSDCTTCARRLPVM